MDELEQFKPTFFQECDELLADLEGQLMALKAEATDAARLPAAFRAVHSIKGAAGMFGLSRIVAFAHSFEAALDRIRAGRAELTEGLIDAALRAVDVLVDLVHAARRGIELEDGYETHAAEHLTAAAGIKAQRPVYVRKLGLPQRGSLAGAGEPLRSVYAITFRPKKDMLRRASEPLHIVRALRELGTLTTIADLSGLPALADLVPTDAYLAWTFKLETSADPAAIRAVFEFVEGNCELSIARIERPAAEAAGPGADGALLERRTAAETEPVTASPHERGLGAALRTSSIRVDLDRVDRLLDLVGEIANSQAMVLQQIDRALIDANPGLFRELSQLFQHARDLRDSVMAMRVQPVRSVFARMPRVVRDVATQTGKKIGLEMSGESTEIDKAMIDELSDPLMHILRNAADHGIEPSDERVAKGKPAEGKIRMSAAQRGSHIIIEVSDDGRGIDRDKVRRVAIEKKSIAADAILTVEETDNLIFRPGLSTAEKVSTISGCGVGMDIVFRNIQRLGGRVSIRSEPGCGSTVSLALPLTLAVVDGVIVRGDGLATHSPMAQSDVERRTVRVRDGNEA